MSQHSTTPGYIGALATGHAKPSEKARDLRDAPAEAAERIAAWPDWMQQAARFESAHFPRKAKDTQ